MDSLELILGFAAGGRPGPPGGRGVIGLIGSPHAIIMLIAGLLAVLASTANRNSEHRREKWLVWAFAAIFVREAILVSGMVARRLAGPPLRPLRGLAHGGPPPGHPPGPPPLPDAVFGLWSEHFISILLFAALLQYLLRQDQPARRFFLAASGVVSSLALVALFAGPYARPWLAALQIAGIGAMGVAFVLAQRCSVERGRVELSCGVGLFALRSVMPLIADLALGGRPQFESMIGAVHIAGFIVFGYVFIRQRSVSLHTDFEALGELVEDRTRELQSALDQLSGANAVLRAQSTLDGLTGARNRRCFDEALHDEWRRAQRSGLPLTVAVVDIDLFKGINDSCGHHSGDQCLVRTAAALGAAARRSGDILSRYGGDEFALLLPGTELHNAAQQLDEIRIEIAQLRGVSGYPDLSFTVSVGIASRLAADIDSPEDLVRLADAELYRAKQNGRNRVETCAPVDIHSEA